MTRNSPTVRVVLFSGGRGSGALMRQLISRAGVSLTIAINGYDDGASTGEVRRFLGDSLGPSDFRKNASRVARELRTCDAALIDLLDARLPAVVTEAGALRQFEVVAHDPAADNRLRAWLQAFLCEYRKHPTFEFADCSVGNIVFAGAYLSAGRDFNRAVADYCALLGLPAGMIENVTDGRNAWLVAFDAHGRLLRTEETIVDARRQNTIRKIFLVDARPSEEETARLESLPEAEATRQVTSREPGRRANPRAAPG